MVMVGALWPYHAALMTLGLALLTTGMLVARYRKARKGWLPLHKALGLAGAIFAFLGLITAVYMVAVSSGRHFAAVPHTYLGALALLFLGMTPLLGYAQFHVTASRSTLRAIHRWSGRITLLLIALTLLSGLSLVGLL
jgi:hypothetical protein